MNQKDQREQLENKIAKYRALARQAPDQETARRIKELADEMEQKLLQIED